MSVAYEMTLVLDQNDYRDIQAEIARYQAANRWPADKGGGVILPDGDSNLPGAILAEAVRSLNEYRDMYASDNPSISDMMKDINQDMLEDDAGEEWKDGPEGGAE